MFNFFKKSKSRLQVLAGIVSKSPSIQRVVFINELEFVLNEVSNLRAMGRDEDAVNHGNNYLLRCYKAYVDDPLDPSHLAFFTKAAMQLGNLEECIKLHEFVVDKNKNRNFIDLTTVYFNLGIMYHRLHGTCEKELLAFHAGATAQTPLSCKFPSTIRDKGKCHLFAKSCAECLDNDDYENYHREQLYLINPDVDWDDMFESQDWLYSE